MGAYSNLTLQGDFLSGSFDPQPITLGTLDFPPIDVPGLPVWVTPEVSIFVGANGNLSAGITTEVSASGTYTGGVTYASGAWSPVPLTPSFQFAYEPPTLNASLSAKAYAGIEFDLYVYDVVGPSFKPDGYLDLEASITPNPLWTLTAGLEGPMSLDVTFLGENLASYDLGTMFNYSNVIASGTFSTGTSNPVPSITSLSPSSLTVGAASQNLTINGTGFLSNSTGTFNGIAHTPTFVSSTQLMISLTTSDLATAGSFPVVVTNPAPGGGTSNVVNFTVSPNSTVTVTVSPPTAQVTVDGLQQFTAAVSNTSNTAVTWSVNGVTGGNSTVGTISAAGLYTAPATVPSPATVTVKATSQASPSVSGSASVTIGPYTETPVYSFTSLTDGAAPRPLILASDGYFYGAAQLGGTGCSTSYGCGTVFKVDSSGNVTSLHQFTGDDGANPIGALIQASDGDFYGMTQWGGAYNEGAIFEVDSTGSLKTLYSFTGGSDGAQPSGALVIGTDGYFYGVTFLGGDYDAGAVFKADSSGDIVLLYSFSGGTDGYGPQALIQARDGDFYGTTQNGGNSSCTAFGGSGCGTVFKIDTAGHLTTLYSFTGGTDGAQPEEALLEVGEGLFYGTTLFGGDPSCTVSTYTGCGTIFAIDSLGDFSMLHGFSGGSEGGVPFSSLIQASDGDFYGTATAGGDPSCSVIASGETYSTYIGCGTVFKMDSADDVSALYSFTGSPSDGSNPFATLVEGSDGYLYGTTRWGGTDSSCPYTNDGGCGTVFKVSGPGGPLPLLRTSQSKRVATRTLNPKPLMPQPKTVRVAQPQEEAPRVPNLRGVKQPPIAQ
jgi:uncharacterized repeat protein (TIGR03803 family)